MTTLKRKLPPLSTLVTFEAAARHLSFTRAGQELNVTQAAVSRQIKTLERNIGEALFLRKHRSLVLTPQAQELAVEVRTSLKQIVNAVDRLREKPEAEQLTISATIAFASLWLAPRLIEFQRLYPKVEVRILATDRDVNLNEEPVDLAFGCGDYSQWSGVEAVFLFANEVFPVCSSKYLSKHGPVKDASDLINHKLLHLDEIHWHELSWQPIGWTDWLKTQGIASPVVSSGLTINNYPFLLQNAVNHQGIALGWRHLVSEYLDQGLLVRPIESSLQTQRGHYLVHSTMNPLSPETRVFRDWILKHVNKDNLMSP